MASRSNNPTSLQFAQNTHIGASERIPTSAFLRQPPNGASSASATGSPQLVGQSGPGRPSPIPGAVGRVGSLGPMSLNSRPSPGPGAGGPAPALRMPGPGGGLAKRRGPMGLNLANMGTNGTDDSSTDSDSSTNGSTPATGGINGRAGRPAMKLPTGSATGPGTGTPFSNFSKIVDPSGSLNFKNKAVLHAKGVDFSTGASFNINMDELELQDELGSGNYGTVQKVFHKVTKVTMAMKVRVPLSPNRSTQS
jgi:mitogen-activated protein kinase kinase